MHEHVYWFEGTNSDLELAISTIEDRIPCFTEVNFWEDNDGELLTIFTIKCRDYDMPFVERMLAPFV